MTVINHPVESLAAPVRGVVHAPITLDPDFPLAVGPVSQQHDLPIRELHWHHPVEIGLCLEGAGVFVMGERVLPFTAGDVTIIGPTRVHLARSAPGTVSRWHWVYLDPVRMLRLLGDVADPLRISSMALVLSGDDATTAIAHGLVAELQQREPGYRAASEALVVQLFVRALRASGEGEPLGDAGGLARIAPAIALIAANLTEPLSLAALARACGASEATVRRQFVSATGRSPQQYWIDLRMQMAASMLRSTTLPVLAISLQVGFRTLSTFNEQFRARYGTTPRQWRAGS